MRILFFSNCFPNTLNPTCGTFNGSLMSALAKQHPVHVVSPVSWTTLLSARLKGKPPLPQGRVLLSGNLTAEFPTFYFPPKLLRTQYGKFMSWSAGRALRRAMNRFRPDAVVAFWTHPDGEVAVRAAHAHGIPAVMLVGGSDVLLVGRTGSRRQAVLNVLHNADAVVPVSYHLGAHLESEGIAADKITVLQTGIDRQLFSPGDRKQARAQLNLDADRKLLIAIGRLAPVKGFDVLIDACGLLAARGVDFSCQILGGGPLQRKLEEQIARLGLRQSVTLAGSRPQQELPDWYRAADLTVLSSHSEGMPNVLKESLCCGTPYVATNVGGVSEVADEQFATLVPPGNAVALANAIEAQLRAGSPPALRPENLPASWDESAERLCEIIDECNARRNAANLATTSVAVG